MDEFSDEPADHQSYMDFFYFFNPHGANEKTLNFKKVCHKVPVTRCVERPRHDCTKIPRQVKSSPTLFG